MIFTVNALQNLAKNLILRILFSADSQMVYFTIVLLSFHIMLIFLAMSSDSMLILSMLFYEGFMLKPSMNLHNYGGVGMHQGLLPYTYHYNYVEYI